MAGIRVIPDAFVNEILDWFFLGGGTQPASFQFLLFKAEPGPDGSDLATTEADYAGYARQAAVLQRVGRTLDNSAVVNFVKPTSGSQVLTHIGLISNTGVLGPVGSLQSVLGGAATTLTVESTDAAGAQLPANRFRFTLPARRVMPDAWVANQAYSPGDIFSHAEEDPAATYTGEEFAWSVHTAISTNEFATWDGTNHATVQAKLNRIG